MGNPLLTRTKCMLEDELTVCDLTENEDREEIEIDTLVVDGEAVSRDVSSNNDHWILYVNTIQFLKVRREGNYMTTKYGIYYMYHTCTCGLR